MRLIKKQLVVLTLNVLLFLVLASTISNYTTSYFDGEAASSSVVIAEIYGGGGSSSGTPEALFSKDYVLLYNRSNSNQSLDGWSLQYASTTGTFSVSSTTEFFFTSSHTINSKNYFLIITGALGSQGSSITNVDATTLDVSIAQAGGKIALANNQSAVTFSGSAGSNTFSSNVIDFVGWGAATAYEGSSGSPATSKILAIRRKSNMIDTDQNGSDFESFTPSTPKYSGTSLATYITDAETFSSDFNSTTDNKFGSCTTEGLDWTSLTNTYNALSYEAKVEFTNNTSNATIVSARDRYQYLRSFNNLLTNFANI